MKNEYNKIMTIGFITMLTLTTGCVITTTRNHYYAYPDQNVKKSNKSEAKKNHAVDTLINIRNGQN